MSIVNIDSIAKWKREMKIGTKWKFIDSKFPDRETIRECTHSQSNSFALNNHPNAKDKTVSSWLDWPKAKEVIFIHSHDENTKVKIPLYGDVYLIYQLMTE